MITVVETAPYVASALGAGGIGVAISRRRELILRWCTWAVTAPVVGGALYLGAPGAATLAAGVGVVCAVEYGRLARLPRLDSALIGVAVVALAFGAWLAPAALARLLIVAALGMACVPLVGRDGIDGLRRVGLSLFGLMWIGALSGLVLLGPAALALFFAVSVADVAAFCGGKFLRGPLLSPLSPAKRWSGVLVGGLVGVAALAVFGALTPALAMAVLLGAPLGDLLESMLKRGAGVKDAATWLPGFGGLLDRVDSLLVALAVAVALS